MLISTNNKRVHQYRSQLGHSAFLLLRGPHTHEEGTVCTLPLRARLSRLPMATRLRRALTLRRLERRGEVPCAGMGYEYKGIRAKIYHMQLRLLM